MRDRVLFSITVIDDDDTGIYSVGELDFSIVVTALDNYLRDNPLEKRDKIFAHLGNISCLINEYARNLLPKNEASECK